MRTDIGENMKIKVLPIIIILIVICSFPRYAFSQNQKAPQPEAVVQDDDDAEFEDMMDDIEEEDSEDAKAEISDPLYYFNKGMFYFNDKLYIWVMEPVASGYRAVVPSPIRKGVQNAYNNLKAPIRFLNCLLQGKTEAAGVELGRFMVNTTFGILGLWNAAALEPSLKPPPDEDFGQTLAIYGVGDGFYLVLPFLGPSTLRDAIGNLGDGFVNPVVAIDENLALVLRVYEKLNWLSFHIGDYESVKEASLDPYEAFKNIYLQVRKKKIGE